MSGKAFFFTVVYKHGNLECHGLIEFPYIQSGCFLQPFQPVHQCIPVNVQLSRSFGNIQIVVKEVADGEHRLVIQFLKNVVVKCLLQKKIAQRRRKLVDQPPDSQTVVGGNSLIRFEYLPHGHGKLRFLVGLRQRAQRRSRVAVRNIGGYHSLCIQGIQKNFRLLTELRLCLIRICLLNNSQMSGIHGSDKNIIFRRQADSL